MGIAQLEEKPLFAVVSAASSGDNTVIAAVAGFKIRVLSVVLVSSGTVTVTWKSAAGGTALSGAMPLTAQTGFSSAYSPIGQFETASGALLNCSLSGAVGVYGWMTYVLVRASN